MIHESATCSTQGEHSARKRRAKARGATTKRRTATIGELSPELGEAERRYCFAIAMRYIRDEQAAEDVAHDALLAAHRFRRNFRGEARYSTWLYRVASTTALMYLRSKRRTGQVGQVADLADLETSNADQLQNLSFEPEEQLAHRDAIRVALSCLRAIGRNYEIVFRLRYLEGYTETEVAARLGLSLATVKSRSHRARLAVRDVLQSEFPHWTGAA